MKASYFAFDRPSSKLLRFLQKHFHLHPPIEQNNNFVVYSDFFKSNPATSVNATSTATATGDKRVKHFGYTLNSGKNSKKTNYNNNNNSNNNNIKNSPSHAVKDALSAAVSGGNLLGGLGLNREKSPFKRKQQQPQRIDSMSHVYCRHEYSSQDRSSKKAAPLVGNVGASVASAMPAQLPQQRQGAIGPIGCHADLQEEIHADWRSGSNKRFQRTALW